MGLISSMETAVKTVYNNLFLHPDWRNYLDILILAVMIYEVMRLVIRTRASSVIKGVFVFLVLAWLANFLQLNVVSWVIGQFLSVGLIAAVILFQPELRSALEQIGRTSIIPAGGSASTADGTRAVNELVQAMSNMSRKRIGALIVVERKTGLREFADTGVLVNADISAGLIENIFEPNTPLHDGATILRNGRILASACILQLTSNPDIDSDLGTRHRAAIGITETTDAVSFIVSEETGVISMAQGGKITRYLDVKTLTRMLTELLVSGNGKKRTGASGKNNAESEGSDK